MRRIIEHPQIRNNRVSWEDTEQREIQTRVGQEEYHASKVYSMSSSAQRRWDQEDTVRVVARQEFVA